MVTVEPPQTKNQFTGTPASLNKIHFPLDLIPFFQVFSVSCLELRFTQTSPQLKQILFLLAKTYTHKSNLCKNFK